MAFFNKTKKLHSGEETEMSFLDHFDELRKHLFRVALIVTVVTIFVFTQKSFVFDTVIFGLLNKDFITYKIFCGLSDITCFDPGQIRPITRELSEQLTVHLKISFFIGLILAFPIILHELWKFIKPGLYATEIKATRGMVLSATLLFYFGCLFGYFIIAPLSICFLAAYTVSDKVENTATLTSLVDSMTMYSISTGIVFELPILVFFLSKLGIMGPEFMRTYRRHAIVIISIVSAIITPPDVTSMILVMLPLMALYEASIFIAKKNYK